MNRDPKIDTTSPSGQASSAPRSNARRRLLQAGISASPVVLSVVSQPVRAATSNGVCRSASAFASFNVNATSSHNPTATCTGIGPIARRSTEPSFWGAGMDAQSIVITGYQVTKPAVVPGGSPITVTNPTVAEVIKYGIVSSGSLGGTERDKLAMNIAAALVNWKAKTTPETVATDVKLLEMWSTAGSGTPFAVTSTGPFWDAAAVNTWLNSTFSIP